MSTLDEIAAQHGGPWTPPGAKTAILTTKYVAAKVTKRECMANDDTYIVEYNGVAVAYPPAEAPA